MNKLIKIAFGIQALLATLALMHNFYIGSKLNTNLLPVMLYTSIAIGVFLSWKVFDKTLTKGTRITAFIMGTVPLFLIFLFLIAVKALSH